MLVTLCALVLLQGIIYIYALGYVLQSSNPGGKPHEVNLKLNTNGNKRQQIIKFKSLEIITCTDSTQAWGFSKSEMTVLWGAKLIEDLCCVKKPKKLECTDVELKTKF